MLAPGQFIGPDKTKATASSASGLRVTFQHLGLKRLPDIAVQLMDSAVSTALKGKTMDEADMGEGPAAGHPVAKADFE